jgi:serine protease SohB
MLDTLLQLGLFTAKALIIVILILVLIAGILALLTRGKEKQNGKITVKNLNEKYTDTTEALLEEVLSKDDLKAHLKQKKRDCKEHKDAEKQMHNVFVLHFHGDIKASAVCGLREEVTAVLGIATPEDEVVVCLESGGGMVHAYGLAAAQLQRLRQHNIPLTVIVDKVAASGGYMMAAVANKILAAPFSIIGSIGVVIQMPNFHRLLKEKHIDFEQLTAGNFKRTLTMFGQNTDEGRDKLREEIDEIHDLFKDMIQHHRPQLDIEKVATGEHWLGTQALELKLVDELNTSDDYLVAKSKEAHVYELHYHTKKSLSEKLTSTVSAFKESLLGSNTQLS